MPFEVTSADRQFQPINLSASGYTTLVPAVAYQRILVWELHVAVAGDTVLKFEDLIGASDRTVIDGPFTCTAANLMRGIALRSDRFGVFQTRPGAALQINNSAAVQLGGSLCYTYIGN